MVNILIVSAIVLYSSWVIYKKVKDAKAGKFCSGCDSCGHAGSCKK